MINTFLRSYASISVGTIISTAGEARIITKDAEHDVIIMIHEVILPLTRATVDTYYVSHSTDVRLAAHHNI